MVHTPQGKPQSSIYVSLHTSCNTILLSSPSFLWTVYVVLAADCFFVCSFALDLSCSRLPQTEKSIPWEGKKRKKNASASPSADKMDNADAGEAGHSAL